MVPYVAYFLDFRSHALHFAEYRQARHELGDISDERPYNLLPFHNTLFSKVVTESVNNLPIVSHRLGSVDPR